VDDVFVPGGPYCPGEVELWESMLETYHVLLVPGALRAAAEPGWFVACVAGKAS